VPLSFPAPVAEELSVAEEPSVGGIAAEELCDSARTAVGASAATQGTRPSRAALSNVIQPQAAAGPVRRLDSYADAEFTAATMIPQPSGLIDD
jgi:hypothetical protein